MTLSNPPLASAYGVWITSITANWQNNGNPAGTYYTAQNMTIGASSTTLYNVWISTGLVPNTTYQFQVNSQNYAGTASSWVSLGSTVTLAAVPPAPLMGGVFITSAAVTINTGTNPYWTQYAIQVSSASGAWTGYVASPTGGFSSTAVYNTTTTWTSSVWVTNLSTNVAFTYSVQAINQYNKPTAFSTSVTSATLAAVPISFVVGNVYTSSMTVNWQSNGNSTYTVYEVSYSTDNFAG